MQWPEHGARWLNWLHYAIDAKSEVIRANLNK
jgi:hypothetical protein